MDIRNPEYFVTLADQKNMRKASELLYVSQPTLSYYLNKLEEDVGCPLFYRSKKELELTTAGQLYLEAAQRTIHIRDEVYTEIARLNREAHIFVLAGSVWCNSVLGWVLPQLHLQFPKVQIETSFETRYAETVLSQPSLSDDQADFCLCSYPSDRMLNDCMEVLYREPLYFVVPLAHPYMQAHPDTGTIAPEEIVSFFQRDTFLISRTKSSMRVILQKMFADAKVPMPEKIFEINGLALTNQMLNTGCGVALMPHSALSGSNPNIVRYLRIQPTLYRYSVLWRRSSLEFTPPQKRFIELVHEYFRVHAEI